jgi:hypothetical protein
MRLSALAAIRRDREQFIYNWILEDDLDLDEGDQKEAKRTRGKADKPRALLCKPSCDEDSRKPRALLCKPRRDEDSRKPRALLCKPSRDEDSHKLKSCQSC